jgi:hypothetical protein
MTPAVLMELLAGVAVGWLAREALSRWHRRHGKRRRRVDGY